VAAATILKGHQSWAQTRDHLLRGVSKINLVVKPPDSTD
jgi:hypothetical protein